MATVAKICKIHGNLTGPQIYIDKSKNNLRIFCRLCRKTKRIDKQTARQYYIKNLLKTKCINYGTTYEKYKKIIEKQNNLCAICLQPEKTRDKRSGKIQELAIDHCHKTNKFRGVICRNCNTGIGMFKDDVTILNKAIKYLKKFQNTRKRLSLKFTC